MVLSHFTTTRPCAHYFANVRTEHVARRVFRHTPRERDLRDLGRMEACLQRPGLRGLVVRYDRHQAALRQARLRWERQAALALAAARRRATTATAPLTVSQPASSATPATTPASGLMACIIQHESGGNPQATNGQYGGIGQWNPAAWAQDGGTRYAPTPTGASYSQQLSVLRGEGTSGMQQQQGQYDNCG